MKVTTLMREADAETPYYTFEVGSKASAELEHTLTNAFADLPAKDIARYRQSFGSLGPHDIDSLALMGPRNVVRWRDDLREEHRAR